MNAHWVFLNAATIAIFAMRELSVTDVECQWKKTSTLPPIVAPKALDGLVCFLWSQACLNLLLF